MNDQFNFSHIVAMFCGVMLFGILLILLGATPLNTRKQFQKEAIANGVAQYKVDTNGFVTFEWKKN